MIEKIIFLSLVFYFWGQQSFAQNLKSEFYPEANGTIGKRTKVNAVCFRTQNVTNPFFQALAKRFGTPKADGDFLQFTGFNRNWTKEKIIIRTSSSIDINLDSSKTNTVFIFVETIQQADLLSAKAISSLKIRKYFLDLFSRKIKWEGR